MARIAPVLGVSDQRKRAPAEGGAAAGSREQRQTMRAAEPGSRRRKPLAAGVFQPEISSFRLARAADGKAAKRARSDTKEVQRFAAAHLPYQGGAGQRAGRPVVDGLAALPVAPQR
jgi:hypothetical protein